MSIDLNAHIIQPQGMQHSSLIWLHGLGADGHDFASLAAQLDMDISGIKFIFPHAPLRPITINNGFLMRGWYDIMTLNQEHFVHDIAGIRASTQLVHDLIASEQKRGVLPENIILGGFSQGGAIALFAGLTAPVKLAGIIALSTYLPAPEALISEKRNDTPPILMIHGAKDAVIALEHAKRSHDILAGMDCEIEFSTYPLGHTVSAEEVRQISAWMSKRLLSR